MPHFVVFSEPTTGHPKPQIIQQEAGVIVLQSLDKTPRTFHVDIFSSASAAHATGGEVFRQLFAVHGPWHTPPTFAVSARWRVTETGRASEFVNSRRRLFELHQRVLPTFAFDWLLQSLVHGNHYLVLGVYGDEAGATHLSYEDPDIQQFIQTHPVSDYAATGYTGAQTFRIDKFLLPG